MYKEQFITGHWNGSIRIWNIRDGSNIKLKNSSKKRIDVLDIHKHLLLSKTSDLIEIWDLLTHKCISSFTKKYVQQIKFINEQHIIVLWDRTLQVIDLSGNVINTVRKKNNGTIKYIFIGSVYIIVQVRKMKLDRLNIVSSESSRIKLYTKDLFKCYKKSKLYINISHFITVDNMIVIFTSYTIDAWDPTEDTYIKLQDISDLCKYRLDTLHWHSDDDIHHFPNGRALFIKDDIITIMG